MLTFKEIRQQFLDFFESKQHQIVSSAPVVVKDDPTLMFINAGMNQFKDAFLGNQTPKNKRVADTQKCLRVSGKHNDLEEVGVDTYHHTFFEMLGNWSFGDYFKEDAIAWAYELLVDVYKIDKDRLYYTYFEGDAEDNLPADNEAKDLWLKLVPADKVLPFDKKDNFWEMGATGPCGPCSEIHIDLRPDAERKEVDGATLVNADHEQVIEIWNLVFMEFNRKADKSLEELPQKHVDTGMGLERLVRVLQSKSSNYDTDVFTPLLDAIAKVSGKTYGKDLKTDIAFRVIADHLRAVSFTIADGQLPSNTGAGYVIRRILRRAIRYGYTYLNRSEPFLHLLVDDLIKSFGNVFPELNKQAQLVKRVIKEEETSFLKTLESGLKKLNALKASKTNKVIDGKTAFELYDTYGFPIDLTKLIADEDGWLIDEAGFTAELAEQKKRSRADAKVVTADWIDVLKDVELEFIGYDSLTSKTKVVKYRTVQVKDKDVHQMVLQKTPFYAESGGQVGDKGTLQFGEQTVQVYNTKKENDLIIHFLKDLPKDPTIDVEAKVNSNKRSFTEKNHSATHLMHAALRQVLGTHVEQKGSLVDENRLRFDFSHFSKMEEEEIAKVEEIVNEKIRNNILKVEERAVPIEEAKAKGAMALFGEKYGDNVRVITFDPNYSVELCGGNHVSATGEIGYFKLVSESAIAAGVRRIEAVTGLGAENFVKDQSAIVGELKTLIKNPDLVKGVSDLQLENANLKKQLEALQLSQVGQIKDKIAQNAEEINGISFIGEVVDVASADALKDLSFNLRKEIDNLFLILGAKQNGKAILSITIADNLVAENNLHAGNLVRELAKEINGGGGGQPFYATAGGQNADGLPNAIEKARIILKKLN